MGTYLSSASKQLRYYKKLCEGALTQLEDNQLFLYNSLQENSIAVIVQHLVGNMKSRWTDYMTSDGEKEWRKRDQEFENIIKNREEMMAAWDEGWSLVLQVIENLKEEDLEKIVYIRNMGHTVLETINRQLCHYAYHIGQIVVLAKGMKGEEWQSLSIPLGESVAYNAEKFSKEKRRSHFTDEQNIDRD